MSIDCRLLVRAFLFNIAVQSRSPLIVSTAILATLLASCTTSDPLPNANQAEKSGRYLVGEIPAIPGPKRVVAVGKFSTVSSFSQNFGDWDLGGGVAAMLVSALMESDRFILVERAAIEQLTAERDLAKKQTNSAGDIVASAEIMGAQFLVLGEITEFGGSDKGRGFKLGLAGLPGGMQTGLGPEFSTGRVAMAVRVVDIATGQIVRNIAVAEKVTATTMDVSLSKETLSVGSNSFNKTPLGEACRRGLTKIVATLAQEAAREPWIGRVVDVESDSIVINAGSSSGVRSGDIFRIFRIAKVFTDPVTGQVLGGSKEDVGDVNISSVEARIASGKFTSSGTQTPSRGDHVASRSGR